MNATGQAEACGMRLHKKIRIKKNKRKKTKNKRKDATGEAEACGMRLRAAAFAQYGEVAQSWPIFDLYGDDDDDDDDEEEEEEKQPHM